MYKIEKVKSALGQNFCSSKRLEVFLLPPGGDATAAKGCTPLHVQH